MPPMDKQKKSVPQTEGISDFPKRYTRRHTGGKDLMVLNEVLGGRRAGAGERGITRSARSAKSKPSKEGEERVTPAENSPELVHELEFGDDDDTEDEDASNISPEKATSSKELNKNKSGKRKRDYESWLVDGPMIGGPCDASLIPSFRGHVACRIWDGDDRGLLKLQSRSSRCKHLSTWFERMRLSCKHLVDNTGLGHLPNVMFRHIDVPLICAFIERWQPDTNTFHLPFGEMTIMLHDVAYILGLPLEGNLVTSTQLSQEELQHKFWELLRAETDPKIKGMDGSWYKYGGIEINAITTACERNGRVPEDEVKGFLVALLGCTLFVDKSGSLVRVANICEVENVLEVKNYSWGSSTLAYLYRQLGFGSRAEACSLGGCLTLLQAWIYEYFPLFRPHAVRGDRQVRAKAWNPQTHPKSEERLQEIRKTLDTLVAEHVAWTPFGKNCIEEHPKSAAWLLLQHHNIVESYNPLRVLRQLGYVQNIPPAIWLPRKAFRPAIPKGYEVKYDEGTVNQHWVMSTKVTMKDPCPTNDPSTTNDDYLSWFHEHSHPFLLSSETNNNDRQMSSQPTEWIANTLVGCKDMSRDEILVERILDMFDVVQDLVGQWEKSRSIGNESNVS